MLAIVLSMAFIAATQGCGDGRNRGTAGGSSTTVWPHGSPEYFVEIPEGYEGLLPGESPEPGEPAPPGEAPVADPGQATVPDAVIAPPRSEPRPPQHDAAATGTAAPRAAPYPLTVREEMSARGE